MLAEAVGVEKIVIVCVKNRKRQIMRLTFTSLKLEIMDNVKKCKNKRYEPI